MERLAAALDRIAELESQLRRKNLPPGRPPRVGPGAPLLPRPKPIMGQDELQDEVDWVRGRV
jgi:hypothetical protein